MEDNNMLWNKIETFFKINKLKQYQKEVLSNLMKGKDCFVSQPTGSGKSLIFQAWPFLKNLSKEEQIVAAVSDQTKEDLVIVISPITSLVDNQIKILENLGIKACYLTADSKAINYELYNIVFTSPETILEKNRNILKQNHFTKRIVGIAVDESHCVKKWGEGDTDSNAFRKWYGRLSEIRSFLSAETPMIAMTATATSSVRQDIIDNLELYQPYISVDVPSKPNVKYFLHSTSNVGQVFSHYVKDIQINGFEAERVIVFCRTFHLLRKLYALFDCKFSSTYPDPLVRPYARYHAHTDDEVKAMINDSLVQPNGKVRFLMASIAFGMGIDCKGLHTVIHFGAPTDIDDYVQESGRVGRDGAQSQAILLIFPRCLISANISKAMKEYCKNKEKCRRQILMGQYSTDSSNITPLHLCCDVCEKNCECDQEDCQSYRLTTFEANDDTLLVPKECSLNSDGIQYLTNELYKLRKSLLVVRNVISPSISSGFPLEAVDEIVSIASKSVTEEDIYTKTTLMNREMIPKVLEILKRTVTEPLFEMKNYDDEYNFSSDDNESDSENENKRYRFGNNSLTESDSD